MNDSWKIWNLVEGMIGNIQSWADGIGTEKLTATLLVMVIVVVFRLPLAKLATTIIASILKRLSITMSDEVRETLVETCSVLLVTLVVFVAIEVLNPPEFAGGFLRNLVFSFAVVSIFSAWYQLVGPFLAILDKNRFGVVSMETSWIERVTKFAILLFGITALLKVWDIDISGALTGVGVLGAGLAIAAQDLVRNLIAGMTNMSEQRYETGDAIEIDGGVSGVVERIDLRSTLLVGFDQIPRYVPNSELSNAIVLNYSDQKRRRILHTISLTPSATPAQVREVRDRLKDYLQTCGDFATTPDASQYVNVLELNPGSIDIMFYAVTVSPEYAEYLNVGERLSLKVFDIVEAAGTELALPVQAIRFPDDQNMPPLKATTSSDF